MAHLEIKISSNFEIIDNYFESILLIKMLKLFDGEKNNFRLIFERIMRVNNRCA